MTDKEQLRKLADAATEGPWEADYSEENNYAIKSPGTEWGDGYAWVSDPDNAAFIAAAREAIPQLLDDLDQWERRSGGHIQTDVDEWCDENDMLYEDLASSESERNLTAIALARAVIRADKADAKVRAVRDALEEPGAMIGGELYISVDSVRRALRGK